MHSIITLRSDPNSWFSASLGMQLAKKAVLSTAEVAHKRIGETIRSLIYPPLSIQIRQYLVRCQVDMNIPKSEWEALIAHAFPLLASLDPEFENVEGIITSLRNIPEKERKAFVQQINNIFVHLDVNRVTIIKELCQISASERESVLKHAAFLFPHSRSGSAQIMLIQKLCHMPEMERESITQPIRSMSYKEDVGLEHIFRCLSRIPAQERASFLGLAKQFLTMRAEMQEGIQIEKLFNTLKNVPPSERKIFVDLAKLFFTDSMTYDERADLFIQISHIPANEREKWIQQMGPLLKETPYKNHKSVLLRCLVYIPENKRMSFMMQVKPLLILPMSEEFRKNLLDHVAKVPSNQLESFIQQTIAALTLSPNFLQTCIKNQESQVPEPHPREPTLDEILAEGSKMIIPPLPNDLHPKHQEILIKALKIKQYYNKRGYICFLHGQEPSRFVLQSLLKEVAKIRNPENHFKDPFVYFRSRQFYEQPKGNNDQIAKDLKKTINHDNDQRDLVMSADAFFLNQSPHESANYFCGETRSVAPLNSRGGEDLDPLMKEMREGTKNVIHKEIKDLMAIFSQKMPCGNLCVICIPKDKVMQYSYPARPGGKFCDCRSEQETLQQLIDANNDIRPKCTRGATTQWRLAAAALRAENGVRSFVLSPNGDFKPFLEKHIKPLGAKIAYFQAKGPTSRL